jgi:hypothetical protein
MVAGVMQSVKEERSVCTGKSMASCLLYGRQGREGLVLRIKYPCIGCEHDSSHVDDHCASGSWIPAPLLPCRAALPGTIIVDD